MSVQMINRILKQPARIRLGITAGLVALWLALALLFADRINEVLWLIPVGFAVTGMFALFTPFNSVAQGDQLTLLLYGIICAGGSIIALSEGLWDWWLALVGVALLPRYTGDDHGDMIYYTSMIVIASVVGFFAFGSVDDFAAQVVLGLGVLVTPILLGLMRLVGTRETAAPIIPAINLSRPPEDEPKRITATVPTMAVDDLIELTTRIHVTADGLVRSTHAMTEVTVQQVEGAHEQATVLKQTNQMMNEFLALSEKVSEQVRSVTRVAQEAAEVSEEGQTSIRGAIQGMHNIREEVTAIATKIVQLAQLTRRIDEIITSVSEIATQSNLLALNASIEAARAGIYGRGFAIVAEEVRSLSQQSTSAAHQVQVILAEIQDAVQQTISATQSGLEEVNKGVDRTQQADETMLQLATSVTQSNNSVQDIYKVIRQQADGLEEIAINMERVDRITEQNLTSTRTVEMVITNLNRLADDLQNAIEVGKQTTDTYPTGITRG